MPPPVLEDFSPDSLHKERQSVLACADAMGVGRFNRSGGYKPIDLTIAEEINSQFPESRLHMGDYVQ